MHPNIKEKDPVFPEKLPSFFKVFARRYQWYVLGLALFALLSGLFQTFINYEVSIGILDSVIEKEAKPNIWLIAYLIFYITMDRTFCFFSQQLDQFYKPRLLKEVIQSLYMQIMKHPLHWFEITPAQTHWFENNPASTIFSAAKDFQKYLFAFLNTLSSIARHGSILIFSLIFIQKICWEASVVLLIFIIVYSFCMFFLLKKELRLQYNAYLSKKESLSIFHDSIDHAIGIKTQASVIRDFSMQLLPSLKKRAAWLKKDLSYQSHYVNMADTLFLLIMGVSQLGLIAHYYHQGFLHSPGEFTFVALISLQVHHELSKLMKKIVLSIQEKIIKIKKAYHFIKRSPSDLDPPNAQALSAAHGEIVYTKVSFTYEPGKEVLKNIDVRILPGQKVALMGTSDSGKRTFIKSLLKYFPLGTGAITIDGQDLAMVTQESLSDPIALITQSTPLFAASVLDNLRIVAPKAPLEAIEQACKKAAIHEDIMAMDSGYNTVLGQQGVHLSEGQSQRLAVARALLKNATIVIFEELTPSDDAPKDPLSASAINAIITESNATRLILAHKKATLLQMDRIFVFDQGSLVQDGTHDQLMKESDGTYKKLLDDWYNYC